MKRILTGLLSLLIISQAVAQQEGKWQGKREKYQYAKETSISKTYPASGNKLEIDNSFGDVKFIRWDKNEIKVDIKIDVSSTDEAVANRTFEGITVTDKQQGNEIEFNTNHSKNGASCKDCKISMHVDYEVHLPASVPIDVENSFGNTEIPDHSAAISIEQKFGNLTAGNLPNAKEIKIEFGSANIKSLANINGVFKFSKIQIGNLSGNNKVKMEFCENSKITLDQNLGSLNLSESYSNVNLRLAGNISATFTVSTNFGNFVDRAGIGVKRTDTPDKYGPDSKRRYEGKSGSGAAKIDLKSDFGNIVLGEPTADDMKEKSHKQGNSSNKVVI